MSRDMTRRGLFRRLGQAATVAPVAGAVALAPEVKAKAAPVARYYVLDSSPTLGSECVEGIRLIGREEVDGQIMRVWEEVDD